MANNKSWTKIFNDYNIIQHDFSKSAFELTAEQIKKSCKEFDKTSEREVRILCKQDTREDRPKIFVDNNLFILPKYNGVYYIAKGEGYVNIPDIGSPIKTYEKKLDFVLESSFVGDSEMQHLDFAYANSLIRTFIGDDSLVLTIRGRKYTPKFSFKVGDNMLEVDSVQTEVDAGFEGKDKIVLVEAKNKKADNTIIRQLYYPYRQWKINTNKNVISVFFEKRIINGENIYYMWQFSFDKEEDYNSIHLVKSDRYRIV
ncbi:MAG: hypothetical protein IJ213_06085 [Bacteroidales bacterium]|nr:hypothetical protein [Bacteroidales bacterium]